MKQDTLFVAYATDDNYAKHLGISMLSLFQTNAAFDGIRVFVLDCGISEQNRKHLETIAGQYGRALTFLPMGGGLGRLRLKNNTLQLSFAYYARLFLATLLPEEIERVLYLDCDTLVMSSLKEAWEVPLGDALVAGVGDTVDLFFLKVIGLDPQIQYVNSGVLLINLKGWRAENLEQKFLDFIGKFDGNVPHKDQGTINGVCKERKYILPPRYNAMSNVYSFSAGTIRRIYFLDTYYTQAELDEAIRNPAVIHFTTGLVGRPWEEDCTHPAKEDYLRILRQSPWKADPLTPNSRKTGLKVFTFFYQHLPLGLFETGYRMFHWILHLKK